jgi:hypothetical protein
MMASLVIGNGGPTKRHKNRATQVYRARERLQQYPGQRLAG